MPFLTRIPEPCRVTDNRSRESIGHPLRARECQCGPARIPNDDRDGCVRHPAGGGVKTYAQISDTALASLRREATQYRIVRVGDLQESTPEGLWYADQRRLAEALLRKVDCIQWEIERDFERRLIHEVLMGPDVPYVAPTRDMDDGLTPERFYERELRRY